MRFRSWRYFWDYSGGNMTDQGTHLMDVVQWFTNSGRREVGRLLWPARQEHRLAKCPTSSAPSSNIEKLMATWTLNYCNSYDNDWSIQFQGDQGTMIINNAGYQDLERAVAEESRPVQTMAAPIPIEPHIQNFLDCVKSRQEPNAPVEVGASAVCAPHLANMAYHQDRRVRIT